MRASAEAVKIAQYISTFLNEYVPLQKTKSHHTLKSYQTSLCLYLGFLETEKQIRPGNFSGDCFRFEYIEEWLVWIAEKRACSPQTCNIRLSSLRAFLKYLGSRDISYLHLSQAASQIERRKETHKKVTGMSKKAVQTLLSVPDTSSKTGRRDLALILTLYSTAARIDEILSLEVKHLHLDVGKPYINIIGKGSKIRTLYILPKVCEHLKKYLEEYHGKSPNDNAYVFYSRNVGQFGKLSQTAVSKRLSIYANSAHKLCSEVPIDLHAHQLRHARASHWLADGINIVQISFLLGHEQLQTTMVYLDVTTDNMAEALATLDGDNNQNVSKHWKTSSGSLADFCGVPPMRA